MSGNPRKHFKNTLKYFFQNKILDPQNIGQNISKNDQKNKLWSFFSLETLSGFDHILLNPSHLVILCYAIAYILFVLLRTLWYFRFQGESIHYQYKMFFLSFVHNQLVFVFDTLLYLQGSNIIFPAWNLRLSLIKKI